MNRQDRELEKLVNEVEATQSNVPPLYELYVTMTSILMATMLFAYPSMIGSHHTGLYDAMLAVMPQSAWAITFFVACMSKAIGLLLDKNSLRVVGLVVSATLYGVLAVCYAMSFPSIGTVIFSVMALFAVISIPFVKHTSIRYKRRNAL